MSINVENASREELIEAVCKQSLKIQEQSSTIQKQDSTIQKQDSTIQKQDSRIEKQETIIEELKAKLSWFERQVFGAKSERLISQDPKQGNLLDVPEIPPNEKTTVKQYERQNRKSPTELESEKIRFSDAVPVEESIVMPDEAKGLTPDQYEILDHRVTNKLMQTPARFTVKRYIRPVVKIKSTGKIYTAPAPDSVIERSYADKTLLASLLVDKFQYHLPLYRQHQRMLNSGVNVARGNLTNLVHRSLELLEPIYLSVLSSVVTNELVCMDETPIKASRNHNGQMKTAYFWPAFGNKEVVFIYSNNRGMKTISDVLDKPMPENRCKKLLSDGYSAYGAYAKTRKELIHAHCWAHVRRKFFEAKDYALEQSEKALQMINALFAVEREATESKFDDTKLLQLRGEKSQPIVDEFFLYVKQLYYEQMVDQNMPLGKAVHYAMELEQGLRYFLAHPDIPLSNNHVERAIRPVAIGRKNWLFHWSEIGARYAAIAFTLIECCKLHGVNPWDYLLDVLERIDTHPARDIQLLTPKYWKNLKEKNAQ